MVYQTEVQDVDAIRLGSCKIEAEAWPGDFLSMTDLGILEGAALKLKRTSKSIVPDNAPEVPLGMDVEGVEITATLLEWTLETLELMGLGTVVDTAGTPVSGATTDIASGAWEYQKFIPVTAENLASITGVSGSANGALVEDDDYIVVTTPEGETGIIVIDSTTVTTEAQILTVTYGYTPVASKGIKIGGGHQAPTYITVKLTNLNASSKAFSYKVYKVQLTSEFAHTFPADKDGKPAGLPVTLTGFVDVTRDADDNLMSIDDEQAV